MFAFPLILIVLKFHSLIQLIIFIFKINGEHIKKIYLYCEAICDPLIGFFNSIIFLFIHRNSF